MTDLTCPRCSEPYQLGATSCSRCALPLGGPQPGIAAPEWKQPASSRSRRGRIYLWLLLAWLVLAGGVLLNAFLAPPEDSRPGSGASRAVVIEQRMTYLSYAATIHTSAPA